MKLSDFDYTLPKELIARYPSKRRDKCRLMVLDRATEKIHHKIFEDVADYFDEGDLILLNDTKVIPSRLFGKRSTGGKVEIFLLDRPSAEKNPVCEALVRPSARLREGERVRLESGDDVEVLNKGKVGRYVKFNRPVDDIIKEIGHVPLPPYIDRNDEESDKGDYQTVYARREGATASPTAGLHFTRRLLKQIEDRGVRIAYLTLHTNYGTFAPIKCDDVESHKMHKEYFELPREASEIVNETKRKGNKVFAVGTTTARVLEHCAALSTSYELRVTSYADYTDLFIYPGYEFKIIDCLITNFHLPKSTLLLLTCAFAGRDLIFEAYRQAIEEKYRFYSYGDAMMIL